MEAVLPPSLQLIEERIRALEEHIVDVEQGGVPQHIHVTRMRVLFNTICCCFNKRQKQWRMKKR
jgi:hypothetical protein